MPINDGWTGWVYEGFEVDNLYRHRIGRTVITVDNILFTLFSHNNNPIHFDHVCAAKNNLGMTPYDGALVESLVALASGPYGYRR